MGDSSRNGAAKIINRAFGRATVQSTDLIRLERKPVDPLPAWSDQGTVENQRAYRALAIIMLAEQKLGMDRGAIFACVDLVRSGGKIPEDSELYVRLLGPRGDVERSKRWNSALKKTAVE